MELTEEWVKDILSEMKALELEVKKLRKKSDNQDKEIKSLKYGPSSLEVPIEMKVSDLMDGMGVPKHLKGYLYLQEAIKMLCEDMNMVGNMVKVVYPKIAKKFETTPSCVERACRHAIDVSWARGDLGLKKTLFGYILEQGKKRPANNVFIITSADYLKRKEKTGDFDKSQVS